LGVLRYLSLLLFIGLAWGQSDYDELIMKNGKTLRGKITQENPFKIFFIVDGEREVLVLSKRETKEIKRAGSVIEEQDKYQSIHSPQRTKRTNNRDDYLFFAGENLHQYVFESIVGLTCVVVGCSMAIISINKDESTNMGLAVSVIGVFYSIKAFFKINSAGTNLKKASGKKG